MSDIKAIVDDISDLPTLPDVVAKINHLITDTSTSASDISDVIQRDVSLSAKILKLVNSPFYGFPRRITTITYAVVILGFRSVRNLALSAFIFDAFKNNKSSSFDLAAFWRHSICVAIASSHVARKVHTALHEDAFMAGLLHDLGKAVMCQYIPQDVEKVCEKVTADDILFIEAENEILGYNHSKIGGLLLEKWNVPQILVNGVSNHHTPDELENPEPHGSKEMCAIVHMGDIIARSLALGSGGDKKIPAIDESAWALLGMDWNDADKIMASVVSETENASAFFAMV